MKTICALRIVNVSNTMLDLRQWRAGSWLRFVRAEEQEPALGFGNFDGFYPCALYGATFYDVENALDELCKWRLSRGPTRPSGVEVEVVPFNEGLPIQ